jgi:alpha-tubulin suppressor-like RCC1 family protein
MHKTAIAFLFCDSQYWRGIGAEVFTKLIGGALQKTKFPQAHPSIHRIGIYRSRDSSLASLLVEFPFRIIHLFIYSFIGMPLGNHTLLFSLEGGLLAFGCNQDGQLGLGHRNIQRTPVEVPWNGPKLVQVDWGLRHSLILDEEGGVWEAGCYQPLDLSPTSLTFRQVPCLPCITLVAAGESHSAAIDSECCLWVWTGDTGLSWARSLPQRVEGLPSVFKVACGNNFLVAEAEEGLWVLGNNSKGQLGLGHTDNALQPTLIQVQYCAEGPLRCLAALYEGVILIDSEGGVFSAGENYFGGLGRSSGDVTKLQRIEDIPPMLTASCGAGHTLSLDENGGVWAWGHGEYGRLGTGNTSHQLQPTSVPSLRGMSALVAGRLHSLAFPKEGGLLVFGNNSFRQLGFNHFNDLSTPALSPVQPELPRSFTGRKKSAHSALSDSPPFCHQVA